MPSEFDGVCAVMGLPLLVDVRTPRRGRGLGGRGPAEKPHEVTEAQERVGVGRGSTRSPLDRDGGRAAGYVGAGASAIKIVSGLECLP